MNVIPGYFHSKIEEKEIPRCLIPLLLVVYTWQLEILVKSLIQSDVVKIFVLYQHFKWSVSTFNLAETTECIFTINNRNNLHYSQTFYFHLSDFEKVFPAKFIQLLIFSKLTMRNLCSDEMKSANLNFRYFYIHVICCSFIIYMGYIKSLEQQMLFIS